MPIFTDPAHPFFIIYLAVPLGVTLFYTTNCRKRKALYWSLGSFFVLSCVVGTDITKFIPLSDKLHFINIAMGTLVLTFALLYGYKANL